MQATLQILQENDFQTVTLDHVKQARERIITARETHLDALSYHLRDKRVRYIIEKLFTGEYASGLLNSDAFRICLDLGLVSDTDGEISVANPIYREVLAREISYNDQRMMPAPTFRWQKKDGNLDMDALLKEFQKFWRKHSEV